MFFPRLCIEHYPAREEVSAVEMRELYYSGSVEAVSHRVFLFLTSAVRCGYVSFQATNSLVERPRLPLLFLFSSL
jgi:hypothetical protein